MARVIRSSNSNTIPDRRVVVVVVVDSSGKAIRTDRANATDTTEDADATSAGAAGSAASRMGRGPQVLAVVVEIRDSAHRLHQSSQTEKQPAGSTRNATVDSFDAPPIVISPSQAMRTCRCR